MAVRRDDADFLTATGIVVAVRGFLRVLHDNGDLHLSRPRPCLDLDSVVLQVTVVIVPVHSAVQGRVQGGALLDVVTTGEVIPAQLRVAVAGDDVPALRVVRLTLDPLVPWVRYQGIGAALTVLAMSEAPNVTAAASVMIFFMKTIASPTPDNQQAPTDKLSD
ncbi:hypothetical protein ABT040_19405 [Streptomyces sp. NPDC002688]|uniref:hypothetical protein n=1 Tax=Streptomyces sp. NPDC002688 TaxID=3154423 RepID=UPI003317E911